MYTSYIGRRLLSAYNERMGSRLSAKAFFDTIFFPLFFDSEEHLMHVSNSPFFQKPSKNALASGIPKSRLQLQKLHEDIDTEIPNMSIYVGFAAKDTEGTTSGQLTSMNFNITSEEMYTSWIGEALGIGVNGGLVLLIDNLDVLWALFTGWQFYRKYLSETPGLKDKQIETWNGQWIDHAFGTNYDRDDPMCYFRVDAAEVMGKLAIRTQAWSKVIFALARKFPDTNITAYVYNLSQTNTTLGFINLYLPEIRRMHEWRNRVFLDKKDTILTDHDIENLATFHNLKNACKLGVIGLKALEPDKLRDFMPRHITSKGRANEFQFDNEQANLNFKLYKIWIIAMLNKTELLQLAGQMAQAMVGLEHVNRSGNRGKTVLHQDIKEILEVKSPRDFISALTTLLEQGAENAALFKHTVEQVVKMPLDHFPLFITLIRFEHAYQKANK